MYATGVFVIESSNNTGDYLTPFGVQSNHVYVKVNAITIASPTITMTLSGASVSESDQIPVLGDTEVMTIDNTVDQEYQSLKKWLIVDSVVLSLAVGDTIDYELGALGYSDIGNTVIDIEGYRVEAQNPGNNSAVDLSFIIEKVQNDGGNKISFVDLENLEVESNGTHQVIDKVRSGLFSRDFTTPTLLWPGGYTYVLKQTDFDTCFTLGENIIDGSNNEGFIVKISSTISLGSPSGVNYVRIQVRYGVM